MKTLILFLFFILIIFDLKARIIYVDPVKNAKYVSINNNIIIGFDETIQSSNLSSLVSVAGSLSGNHSGEIILTADRKKLIFKPYLPFAFNEKVEVKLNSLKTSFNSNNRLTYTFQTQISKPEVDYNKFMFDESENSSNNNYVYSDNYGLLPQLTVTISNNPSPGHLFLTNYQDAVYSAHYIIAENTGTPYYTKEFSVNVGGLKRQPNGLVTYLFLMMQRNIMEKIHNIIKLTVSIAETDM